MAVTPTAGTSLRTGLVRFERLPAWLLLERHLEAMAL
jgi:hypothetical protein